MVFLCDSLVLSHLWQEHDAEVRACAGFLTQVTLDAIKGVFSEAKSIMDWLATLATLVAKAGQPMSWVTPLGLPVVQPYRCVPVAYCRQLHKALD